MKILIIIAIILLTGYLVKVILRYRDYLIKSKKRKKKTTIKTGRQQAMELHKKYLTEAEIKILNLKTKDRETSLEDKLRIIRENDLKVKNDKK